MRRASGALIAVAVLSGCGGYAAAQPPQVAPTSSAAPTSTGSPLSLAAQAEASARAITEAPVGIGAPSGQASASSRATPTATVPGQTAPPAACAVVGPGNVLVLQVPGRLRAGVATLRVQLLQGALSRQVIFALGLPSGSPAGVTRRGPRYLIGLGGDGHPAALDGPWVPAAAATVIVEARRATESVVVRRTQRFRFTLVYPKHKPCGQPNFSHDIALRVRDRI